MNIGMTGCDGFIGSAVADSLKRNGYYIVSLDCFTRCSKGDHTVLGVPQGMRWVLHFGAHTSIRQSLEDPFGTYASNIDSTLKAMKIAWKCNAAFLYMSSYIYGRPRYTPVDENHPVEPSNPYMGSKATSERLCRQLGRLLGIKVLILRAFNIYGLCWNPGRLICDLLVSARDNKPFILNDPASRRDYLYIKDFQELILRVLQQKSQCTGVYNVGYGKSYSNIEVATMFSRLAGAHIEIIVRSQPRPGDVDDCVADTRQLRQVFDWTPVYSLEAGLKETLSLLREGKEI